MDTSKKYDGEILLKLICDKNFNYKREPSVVIGNLIEVIEHLHARLMILENKNETNTKT